MVKKGFVESVFAGGRVTTTSHTLLNERVCESGTVVMDPMRARLLLGVRLSTSNTSMESRRRAEARKAGIVCVEGQLRLVEEDEVLK